MQHTVNSNLKKWYEFKANRETKSRILMNKLKMFIWAVLRAILIFGMSFLIIYPIAVRFPTVIMSYQDLVDTTVNYIPRHPTLDNVKYAINEIKYWTGLRNLAAMTTVTSLLEVLICTTVGYGFSRFKFRGKNLLFAFVILSLLVPPQVIFIPLYMKFRFFDIFGVIKAISGSTLNLIDTPWSMLILSFTGLGLKNGLYIFVMRQYFNTLPKDIEEAAYIDGAGTFKTYMQIMLPNGRTMMVTIFLLSFSWHWTDSFYAGLLFNKFNILTNVMSSSTARIADPAQASAILNACSLLLMIPVLILYIFGQKLFIQGIERRQ